MGIDEQLTGEIVRRVLAVTKPDWIIDRLRGLGFPFDVFVIVTERFAETKNIFGGIAYPANKQGRVIYEAA